MTAQQLKNSILQLAVQGKLVPQDPNDEPASVLLERIRAEKEALIKAKKIKREKNPSVIFRGADNTPYEKIGNEVLSLEDEIPFEIPNSWEWVRLGNIGDWGSGATPSRSNPEYYGGTIPWLKTGDLNDGYIDNIPEYISELALEKTSVRLNPVGSVLIAMYGATIGKLGILNIPATTNQACCACYPLGGLYNEYLFYFLLAQKSQFIKQGEGGAQPNISKEKIVATLMPVPPIEEQYRIVDKLKAIFPLLSEYATAESTLDKFNRVFPEQLKKSILQWAVQGKLVPQNENDEPAEVLLKRIRAEKEALIKAGKIKRDKHESVIFRRDNSHYEKLNEIERCIDDEIPFDIPDSWVWVRLKNLVFLFSGNQYTESEDGIFYVKVADMNLPENQVEITTSTRRASCDSSQIISPYSIIFPKRGGAIATNKKRIVKSTQICVDSNTMAMSVVNECIFDYIKIWFDGIDLGLLSTGTSVPQINNKDIEPLLVPLPPYNEQKRIVEAVEKVLPHCENL